MAMQQRINGKEEFTISNDLDHDVTHGNTLEVVRTKPRAVLSCQYLDDLKGFA